MLRSVLGVATVGLLVGAAAAGAQNLATNGGFAVADGIDGWSVVPTPYLTAEWSALDHANDAGSGSLLGTNTAPGTANLAIVSCVDSIADGVPYQFSGFARVSSGQDATGSAHLYFYWYDNPSCAGTQTAVEDTAYVTGGDSWIYMSTHAVVAPAGTKSAWLALDVSKSSATAGTFLASFDDLDFRATLFHDGFESGELSYWSMTMP
jgi:hypothetical protein